MSCQRDECKEENEGEKRGKGGVSILKNNALATICSVWNNLHNIQLVDQNQAYHPRTHERPKRLRAKIAGELPEEKNTTLVKAGFIILLCVYRSYLVF
jgi:hypothetical protein